MLTFSSICYIVLVSHSDMRCNFKIKTKYSMHQASSHHKFYSATPEAEFDLKVLSQKLTFTAL